MRLTAINFFVSLLLVLTVAPHGTAGSVEAPVSDATQECLACHSTATPTIVEDWKKSRHAVVTPSQALGRPDPHRRVSASNVSKHLSEYVVGCAECHTLNAESHKDTVLHNEKRTHLTVTPRDCCTCHPAEAEQYEKNLMAFAHVNLVDNAVYSQMMNSINGAVTFDDRKTTISKPDEKTQAESCLACHGTNLQVTGVKKRETDYGEMEFVEMSGYPNQGVGRLNPDGSKGSCSSCHGRHQFSIQMARKPYTCSQCHKGPDVPAYKIYSVSKHGTMFASMEKEWNFNNVPWVAGKDFTAPTCATCHVSLVTDSEGKVVSKRTHQMSERLPWRIFGLIYSHAHPKSPDTTIIKNKDGIQLPTSLDGQPASEFLISGQEQDIRKDTMQAVCLTCHSQGWVKGHWERFQNTLQTTDSSVFTATKILFRAWDEKLASKDNLFDEAIEKQWTEQWLFFANSTRMASAMMGNDYGVFDNGRWYMNKNIQDMLDRLFFLRSTRKNDK